MPTGITQESYRQVKRPRRPKLTFDGTFAPMRTAPNAKDRTGIVYGRLTVLGYAGDVRWWCRCECGRVVAITGGNLNSNMSRSCGCLAKQVASAVMFKHGYSRKPRGEYRIWVAMRARCNDPSCNAFRYYGGRGIKVCQEWQNNFVSFLSDVGPRPSNRHTLDRIDANGNYEPGNCRWVTWDVQANNKRNTVYLNFNGERLTESQLGAKLNIRRETIARWRKNNQPLEEMMAKYMARRSRSKATTPYTYDEVMRVRERHAAGQSIGSLAREIGASRATISKWLTGVNRAAA